MSDEEAGCKINNIKTWSLNNGLHCEHNGIYKKKCTKGEVISQQWDHITG